MVYGQWTIDFTTAQIKMCKELPGVNTAVGAAAAGGFNGLPQYGCKGFVQHFLHAFGIVLHLPSMIPGAVIS
jgi:hypothetical protein